MPGEGAKNKVDFLEKKIRIAFPDLIMRNRRTRRLIHVRIGFSFIPFKFAALISVLYGIYYDGDLQWEKFNKIYVLNWARWWWSSGQHACVLL